MQTELNIPNRHSRLFWWELILLVIALVSGVVIAWLTVTGIGSVGTQIIVGVTFTLSLVGFIRLLLDPDSMAARQSDELLKLASQTLEAMNEGLTPTSAQTVCELLLPSTQAQAVVITNREVILGYAGYDAEHNPAGAPIRTTAILETLEDAAARVLFSNDEIGLPMTSARLNGAIIEPLLVGRKIHGTLLFGYNKANRISQTQRSVAHGFAELLSSQMAANSLEEQVRLATSMELKALQAQINPHFLFNTINTIASLIRTDPNKARELLREFAVFYRSTLEDSNDLIPLEREVKQVERYFAFETARFGEERLNLTIDVDDAVREMLLPSFMIQPLVENCVRHGMKSEGQLRIQVNGHVQNGDVIIEIIDNGVGMDEQTRKNMLSPESSQGLGIAVKNVNDRMRSYFGPDAHMDVESALGLGTTVSFTLPQAATDGYLATKGPQEFVAE